MVCLYKPTVKASCWECQHKLLFSRYFYYLLSWSWKLEDFQKTFSWVSKRKWFIMEKLTATVRSLRKSRTSWFILHFCCFDFRNKYQISSLEMCRPVKNETDQMVPDKVNEFADWWNIFISIPDFPNWSTSTRWSWMIVIWSKSFLILN